MYLISILANDYSKEWLEVLVVDGISKELGVIYGPPKRLGTLEGENAGVNV
jgi:hypothetical protein